jgi:hypothetical protein
MTITAILRTRWFGREADEEYLFHIICRGPYDFIILEEKNTDKRYRVEYDNQYRKIDHKDALADTMINWTFYTPIIGDICALIEHRVEKIELLGNPDKYPGNVTFHNVSADNSATISLAMPIEAEYQYIRNHISQAGS